MLSRLPVMAAMIIVLATFGPVQAANLSCPSGDVTCLIAAINTANGNGEEDTIMLAAGTYTLTAVDNATDGANGLPSITSVLTIQGAGAENTILERAATAPPFRLLHVSPNGVLQLDGLTVRGGRGGILNFGAIRITHSRVTDNTSDSGGGLDNVGGAVTIANAVFANNFGDEGGGGLHSVEGTVQISESSFLDNEAGHSAGAFVNCGGTATIAASTFAHNGGDPAAIINSSGFPCESTRESTMTIGNTTIADTVGNVTGGLVNDGTMLVLNSAIVRNFALSGVGGIWNRGSLTLINTTMADNLSPDIGGIDNGGSLSLINTTVADNEASLTGAVGGLRNSGTAVLVNTILARNTSGEGGVPGEAPDCNGPITSQGSNLIGDLTGCTVTLQPSDLTGNPGLGSLADDGSPGHAHLPLLAASPAINAGDNDVCTSDPQLATDQLGNLRVDICDIGAIEFQAPVVDTIPPVITIAASPTTLWPPNGKLVSVRVVGTMTDEPGGSGVNASSAAFMVLDEYGQLQPRGSLTLRADGHYTFTVALKASRRGNDRDGRHYTIVVSAEIRPGTWGLPRLL